MAWRTVQKDGAIAIYGSLFTNRRENSATGTIEYRLAPGTKVWVEDGFKSEQVQVWNDKTHHTFLGTWNCRTVWDKEHEFYRPEKKAETRLRHLKDQAQAAIEEVRATLDDAETALETFPAERVDLSPVDVAMTEFEEKARAVLAHPAVGAVTFLALFMAFDPSKGAPKRQLRTEAFTFGYPVYKGDITAQQTADTIVDEVIASYDLPAIRRMTAEELAPFLKVGDDWSWDDADREAETQTQPASGDDPQ